MFSDVRVRVQPSLICPFAASLGEMFFYYLKIAHMLGYLFWLPKTHEFDRNPSPQCVRHMNHLLNEESKDEKTKVKELRS